MMNTYDLSELDDIDEVELADQLEQIEVLIPHDEEQITAQHYSIFLKYAKINEKFITEPEQYEKLVKRMVTELHTTGVKKSPSDWLIIMSEWREKIKRDYDEYRYREKPVKFTAEELELLNLLIKDDKTVPSQSQLSCMLDHLEIASESPKLWATINLEMESLGILNRDEHYWRKMYEKWCSRVKLKKQMVDDWDAQNSFSEQKPNNIFNSLELRLIEFLSSRGEMQSPIDDAAEVQQAQIDILSNYCRVCLTITPEMVYIFSEIPEYGNIVDKINHCATISPIVKDDGFPQNICQSCMEMLENAYRFKVLCEKSDSELHTISKEEFVKLETREYFDNEDAEIFDNSNNCSEVEMSENLGTDVFVLAESGDNYDDSFDKMEVLETSTNDYDTNEDSSNSKDSGSSSKPEDNEKKQKGRLAKSETSVSPDKSGSHQCETCGIVCDNTNSLRIHIKSHASPRPHRCSYCEKDFKTRLSLKIHIRSHTGERPYVCEVCAKTFSQKGSLVYHRRIHLGIRNFECGLCEFRARSQNDLNLHSRTHSGIRPYTCSECDQKFTTSSNLQKHMRRRHTGEKNFQTCGKAFKTCSAVNNHKAIHSGVKEFKCAQCPYQACTKANLKIHDRTHSGVQPYSCRFCVLKFSTASNMHKHIRNIHQKLKTHKCDQCTRSFFSRESARKHMVTHTKLKPYSCTHCPMAYGWYNGLQKHMKSQHADAKMPTEKSFFVQMEKELELQKPATETTVQLKIEG